MSPDNREVRSFASNVRSAILVLLRKLLLQCTARLWPTTVADWVTRMIRQCSASLPPADGLRFLLDLDNRLYDMEGEVSVKYGSGTHIKHRLLRFDDYLVERIKPGERVLDVACGSGPVASDIAKRANAHVVGIDKNAGAVQKPRELYPHDRVVYKIGTAPEDVINEHFDVIVLSNVLEHEASRPELLKHLCASATPNKLLIRVPLYERDWRVPLKKELGVAWRLNSTHEIEYTQKSFEQDMMKAGLMITHQQTRWSEIWAEVVPVRLCPDQAMPRGYPAVCYLHPGFPAPVPELSQLSSGGGVKYLWLNRVVPHQRSAANLVYGISSAYASRPEFVADARVRGARFVWNQDGVGVPWSFAPDEMERVNRAMGDMYRMADYVLYQSLFCRESCDRFLGKRHGAGEVLYNAVDTKHFVPPLKKPEGLVLLISGSHENPYRLPVAVATLAEVRRRGCAAILRIAGRVRFASELEKCVAEWGMEPYVDVVRPYNQCEAPDIYKSAHILLHTKYNDPCPSVVIEAMACGLPVVYSASGGVPELVGDEAGIGVPAPLDWQNSYPPDPVQMAEAVLRVVERLPEYSVAARRRAVEQFDIRPWLERHRQVFEMLLGDVP